MKNIIYTIAIILMAAITASSCSGHDEPPAAEKTPRAVLVYMVANNSLGSGHYDAADLGEMQIAAKEGDLGKSRLYVYHHGRNSQPVLKEITPEGERVVTLYDNNVSSVTSQRMARVIADFRNDADALRQGIILWSHGSGWIENGIVEESVAKSEESREIKPLSFGDDGGRYMNVTTLAKVLKGKGFDFIYFDCCYMAGVEVAYELRHCADRIVASATELPATGMPYDETLRYLMKPEADLISAARTTFDHYDKKSGQSRTCTISVIDTGGLDRLADATRAVYMANNATTSDFRPQHFMTSACYIFDFGQYVDDLSAGLPELKAAFHEALDNAVLFKAATPTVWGLLPLNHHSGLSTYLPDFATTSRYNYDNLQWASDVASALGR